MCNRAQEQLRVPSPPHFQTQLVPCVLYTPPRAPRSRQQYGTIAELFPLLSLPLAALQAADVVVVVAGCDPALPAVIAGLVDAPVVAVPTSSGSSGNMGGLGVLAAAVASATPGVAVVGVDDAIAAAVMAARVLRTAAVRMERLAAASAAAAAAMPASPAHAVPAVVLPPAEAHSMLPPQCVEAGLTMQAGQAQATVARAR